jgi:hypothetical protein
VNHLNTILAAYGASVGTIAFIFVVTVMVLIGRRMPR